MNAAEARSALRWAVFNPDAAQAAGGKMLESVPQVMTTVGAYLLSEWLSRRYGKYIPGFEKQEKPTVPDMSLSYTKVEGA